MNKFVKPLVAASLLSVGVSAHAFTIDFESDQGAGAPADNLNIDRTAVFTDGTTSVTLGFDTTGDLNADTDATFEAVGAADGFPRGFANSVSGDDTAIPGASSSLDDFFLRTQTTGQSVVPSLVIDYLTPVSAASAEIWDIDARNNGGVEQYRIQAFDGMGGLLSSIDSPAGQPGPPGFGETNPLNGDAYTFGFSDLGADISKIVISYIGTAGNVGLAFDNFNVDEDVTNVPTPGALSLLALGLLAAAPRLRSKK